jgi:stearoyl-CoA desaturase (delta-9 desaturase)
VLVHLSCLAVFWVGFSWTAFSVALGLYIVRMFGITGFYHRYFSHKAFKAGRGVQLAGAVLGCASAQRGPLWWASHHRYHHQHADTPDDAHSPVVHGFLWSHLLWFLSPRYLATLDSRIKDFAKYPELRFLDRYHVIVPVVLGVGLYLLGDVLARVAPGLGTNGWQMFIWGFSISTVAVYHATYTINSLSHLFGRRTYDTNDHSRNNWLLAILTLGEGWHNNHHHYPVSARQGFRWWQYDVTYYILLLLQRLGLVHELRPLPTHVRDKGLVSRESPGSAA